MDHHPRFEVIFPVDDHIAVDVPFDAGFAHPVNRRGGLRHQDLGQFFVDPSLGHPLQVGVKLFRGIGRDMQLGEQAVRPCPAGTCESHRGRKTPSENRCVKNGRCRQIPAPALSPTSRLSARPLAWPPPPLQRRRCRRRQLQRDALPFSRLPPSIRTNCLM